MPLDAALALVDLHVARLAADEGFVHFDFTGDRPIKRAFVQGIADAVIQEPCGFLSDLQVTRHLRAADAVLAVNNEPEGGEPLVEADGGIFHHGSGFERELGVVVLAVALPNALFLNPENFL